MRFLEPISTHLVLHCIIIKLSFYGIDEKLTILQRLLYLLSGCHDEGAVLEDSLIQRFTSNLQKGNTMRTQIICQRGLTHYDAFGFIFRSSYSNSGLVLVGRQNERVECFVWSAIFRSNPE